MKRTKLADRHLPDYTKGEEIFNMVSHIVGGAFGIAALVLCVIMSAIHGSALGVVTSVIYGVSLISLYCMSSIYHGLRPGIAKKVFQVLDHCTIYFLIAGSYTPVLMVAFLPRDPVATWILFGIVWGCAIIACTLTAIDLKKFEAFSMICYIAMGWAIIFYIKQTFEILTFTGGMLLLVGGIAYTIGAVLYGIGKRIRYMHSIFHLFILAGSIFQFFAILLFAIPAAK